LKFSSKKTTVQLVKSNHPHAYVKLWKHHGAQDEATQMVEANEKANQN
jgi:L-ribulokinase